MKPSLKLTLLASSFIGLAIATAPGALARSHGWDDRNRSVSSAPETGGYCDSAGCPDRFWKYPIHYGPVFFHGQWYRGPVYYRGDRYARQYWVHGGWHRDEWRGRRPSWARQSHDGPPLAFEYYADHGFQLSDHWRHEHEADSRGDNRWNGRDHRDNGGDNRGDWRGRDNSGNHDHGDNNGNWQSGDNGGNNANRDWRSGGNGAPDQHAGNGSNGQAPVASGNTIHVTAATYGATCHQPLGNVTKFLTDACNGRATCDYVVQYQTIGDPAPGCAKDFAVQWTCSAGPGGSAAAPAEAGLAARSRCNAQTRDADNLTIARPQTH